MVLNHAGNILRQTWLDLHTHFPTIQLDLFSILPNHFHGIIILKQSDPKVSLPEIIRFFKVNSARRINALHKTPGKSIWQRSYYEHIIRDEVDLKRIRQYIIDNPAQWEMDHEK